MNITDIFDRIIIKSGQYLMTKANIELDETRFMVLVEDVLETYNKYCPLDTHFTISIPSNGVLEFTDTTVPYGIPEFIVDAVPVGGDSNIASVLRSLEANRVSRGGMYLDQKSNAPFEYRNPILSTLYTGTHDIHAAFHYFLKTEDIGGGTIQISIPNMTVKETYFFEMLKGAFLQGLGRSRRSFTITDLPITMDSDQITSEGQEIYNVALENLQTNASKFWLAYGG